MAVTAHGQISANAAKHAVMQPGLELVHVLILNQETEARSVHALEKTTKHNTVKTLLVQLTAVLASGEGLVFVQNRVAVVKSLIRENVIILSLNMVEETVRI